MGGKWLQLLKEIVPRVARAAVIRDSTTTGGVGQFAAIQSMAPSLGMEAIAVNVRDPNEIERTITDFGRSANGGLIGPEAVWRLGTNCLRSIGIARPSPPAA